MVILRINQVEVTVPKGSTILEAAEKAGVYIPTLCHDKRIAPYGACRLCVVEDRNRPGNLMPSCFTLARDRMDLATDTPLVLEAVRKQLQLILVHHPLECPVCDKAGECSLQFLVNQYDATVLPVEIEPVARLWDRRSPLIERRMSRCILCGRCVRICGELQGRHELDFIRRGFKSHVDTDGGRPLDCDFCGLCVSTCPVGALNDKLFIHTTRVWNLEKIPSVCSHCGMNCDMDLNLHKGKLHRVTPPVDREHEKGLLCVRGQFGWRGFVHPSRLATPLIRTDGRSEAVSWERALAYTTGSLATVTRRHGGDAVAILTADQLTTEEALGYSRFARSVLGGASVSSFQAAGYRRLVSILNGALGSGWKRGGTEDLSDSDVLIVLGGGAIEMHPVLKPIVNRHLRKENRELVVMSSWPDYLLSRATLSLEIRAGQFERFCLKLGNSLASKVERSPADATACGIDTRKLARFVSLLHQDLNLRRTLLVSPDPFGSPDAVACLAAALHDRVSAVIPLGAQFNSSGAVLDAGFITSAGLDVEEVLDGIEQDRIRALYLLGDDPLEVYPDPARIRSLLGKLDLLIYQGSHETPAAALAHVVLPSAIVPEKTGSTRSLLGVDRRIQPVLSPPSGARSDLSILQGLIGAWEIDVESYPQESSVNAFSAKGTRLARPASRRSGAGLLAASPMTGDYPFVLMAVPSIFGDAVVSLQSPELRDLRRHLRIRMNTDDFDAAGFCERETVRVTTPFGSACGVIDASAEVRRGTLLVTHLSGHAEGLTLIRPGRSTAPAAIARRNP